MEPGKAFALMELLDSSDSSSSSEDEYAILIADEEVHNAVPKIRNFIEDVVHNYTDKQFQGTFRLRRPTCYNLIAEYQRSEFFSAHNFHSKTAEAHILSFLWYTENKSTFRTTSELFNMSLSTAFKIFDQVMDFLLTISPSVIVWPESIEQKRLIADEFEEIAGIPGIIGSIDGCLINIRTPANKLQSTYINGHDATSMTLQGICDARYRFIDCFTGVSSRIHDSRILQLSFIYPLVHEIQDQYHLIGDAAYGISKNLLTPFKDYGNLTNTQVNYNEAHSKSRVKIENAFAILKARFQQLIRLDFHTPMKDAKFIICCCVLHNICIEHDDYLLEMDDTLGPHHLPEYCPINIDQRAGVMKRHEIAESLPHNGNIR